MRRALLALALMAPAAAWAVGGGRAGSVVNGGGGLTSGTTPVSGGTNLGIFYLSGGVITNGTGATFNGTTATVTALGIGSLTGGVNTGSMGIGAGYYWTQGSSQGLQFNLPTFIGTNLQFQSGTQLFADNGSNAAPAIAGENVTTTGLKWTTTPALSVVVSGSAVSTFTTSGLTLASLATGALPAAITVTTSNVSATGTPSATTYLRGDNSWATVSAGGLTIGNAVSGGVANGVIFEDASQNVASTATVKISTSTGGLTLTSTATFSTYGIAANGYVSGVPCQSKNMSIYGSAGPGTTGLSIDVGNGSLYLCVGGTEIAEFDSATFPQLYLAVAGSATHPSLGLASTNSGLFGSGSAAASFSVGGTENFRLTSTGLKVGAAANPSYALDIAGDIASTARTILTPTTVQSVQWSTSTIAIAGTYTQIGSTGTITLTGVPTIATTTAVSGQYLIIDSTSSVITLQDKSALTNSGLCLSAATVAVSTSTPVQFLWSATGGCWKQIK